MPHDSRPLSPRIRAEFIGAFAVTWLSSCGAGLVGGASAAADDGSSSGERLQLIQSFPANGDQDVTPASAISLTFDRDVDPASVDAASIQVTYSNGSAVQGELSVSEQSITFEPTGGFRFRSAVAIELDTSLMSVSGVRLDTATSVTFETGAGEWKTASLVGFGAGPTGLAFQPSGLAGAATVTPAGPAFASLSRDSQQWDTPSLLRSGTENKSASVASTSDGGVLVAVDHPNFGLFLYDRSPGSTIFGVGSLLEMPPGTDPRGDAPQLASAGETGIGLLAPRELTGGGGTQVLVAALRRTDGSWTPREIISEPGALVTSSHLFASRSSLIAVWTQAEGGVGDAGLYANVLRDDAGWSLASTRRIGGIPDNAEEVGAASNGQGGYVVLTAFSFSLMSMRFGDDPTGDVMTELVSDQPTLHEAISVAHTGTRFVAVHGAGSSVVISHRNGAANAWTEVSRAFFGITAESSLASDMLEDGTAFFTTVRQQPARETLRGSSYVPSSGWSEFEELSIVSAPDHIADITIKSNRLGRAVVLWGVTNDVGEPLAPLALRFE
ncbi:MAG: Ig-like domain-containing protein [Planctomycetota bacterium]